MAARTKFFNFCGVRLKIISAAGRNKYKNVRLLIFNRGASFQGSFNFSKAERSSAFVVIIGRISAREFAVSIFGRE